MKNLRTMLFLITFTIFSVLLSGCQIKKNVSGIGIPSSVNHIEFWNGSALIGAYEHAKVSVSSSTSVMIAGKDISYYVYKIVAEDGTVEYIVDSESLAIKYW